jgi:translocation and assembly module TamB
VVGPLDGLVLGGRVGLRNCRVMQSIDLLGALERGSSFESQQTGLLIAPFPEGPLANLTFDVQVESVEPIDLRGNLMRGGAKASLHLKGTGRGVHPDGTITVQPTRVSLPGGTLTFTGGSVRFDEANPLFPTLDLYGETRMIGYDVTCRVTGTTADPVVELASSPPLSQDALLILLLTGRLPSEATGQQAAEALTVYIARDALRRMFSNGLDGDDESWVDRFEYESGREISEQGVVSLEARFRIADELVVERDAVYIVAERDRFEDFNLGLRLTLRRK